ncbi:PilZ domain-containing protein [Undibacterium sp. MH2W]|uniref:PilZ domain-containing protein n=1 Tax=Undibacterium sp. MH2W TaxID=3413044 RepID=UPI003BF3E6E5
MSDSRTSPRLAVAWRAAIQIAAGRIVPAKIINFSAAGIQIQTSVMLREKQTYPMMMEVPSHKDASARTQVVCKGTCQYTILSGNEYRAGMKCTDFPPQHRELLESWGG